MRHLPVVTEGNTLVGILTDRDIRQAGASDEPHLAEHELTYLLDKMTVQELMTRQVVTVYRQTSAGGSGGALAHTTVWLPASGAPTIPWKASSR